jgi:serine/threonine-protein kinase
MTPLRLGSRYQLEEQMGEGGLGVVWRGSDIWTGAGYAIKMLRPEHAADPATVARFVRERTALLRFRHPNVVVLRDMIMEGDRLALVMDLVADGDLAAHRRRHGGTLGPAEATDLMAQACAGLAAAHAAGIVHRDLKPANILLDGGQVRLTDFGIAQVAGEPTLTGEGTFLGSLHYLAPEVIQGDDPTPACDSYAVGVTLYELLSGHPPFTGQPAAVMYGHLYLTPERPDGVPDTVWPVIAACLDKDPRRRPSAAELERTLHFDLSEPIAPGSGLTPDGWRAYGAGARGEETMPRAAVPVTDPPALVAPAVAPPAGVLSDGAPGRPRGPAPPGGQRPPRRRAAAGWAVGTLALLAAVGLIALALARSPGTERTGADGATVTATGGVAPVGHIASLSGPTGAASGGQSPQPGSTAPETSASARPDASPVQTGTAVPTPGPSVTSTSTETATASSPSATAVPSASPTASPSPTGPADTAWQCGPVAPAKRSPSGKDTDQTLQACIRVSNGKLELRGTLNDTVTAWREQVILVLEDSGQNIKGTYTSPACVTTDCTYDLTTVPASGRWTVLPEWAKQGKTQGASTGSGFVDF